MPADGSDGPEEHYFTERPRSRSAPREHRFLYRGQVLSFRVDQGVFAAHGLDPGTELLITALDPRPSDRILDLGCGWGAGGIAAARAAPAGRVFLTDVNRRAVSLARGNARRNGIDNVSVLPGSLFAPVEGE